MLGNNHFIDSTSFKGIEPAGKRYEGALGSQQVRTEENGTQPYKREISRALISESRYARNSRDASATWAVGDEIDTMLQALKGF